MELLVILVYFLVAGAIIGALGRLALPGPDPMTLGQTILVGIGGSFVGGLVAVILFGPDEPPTFLLSVLGATFIVWLVRRSRRRRALP